MAKKKKRVRTHTVKSDLKTAMSIYKGFQPLQPKAFSGQKTLAVTIASLHYTHQQLDDMPADDWDTPNNAKLAPTKPLSPKVHQETLNQPIVCHQRQTSGHPTLHKLPSNLKESYQAFPMGVLLFYQPANTKPPCSHQNSLHRPAPFHHICLSSWVLTSNELDLMVW